MFRKKGFGYRYELTWWGVLRVAIAFIVGTSACLLACALITFDPCDSSWFFASTSTMSVHNMMGSWGACIASCCFFFLGASAYCLVLLLATIAYRLLISRIDEYDIWVGYGLVMAGLSALCAGYHFNLCPHIFSGGSLGIMVYGAVAGLFDHFLATIFCLISLSAGLLLIADFVWIRVAALLMNLAAFLCNKEKFLKPLWAYVHYSVKVLITFVIFCCKKLWLLLNGSHVHNAEQSVVSFEQLVEQEWVERQHDDRFWDTLFNKQPSSERNVGQVPLSEVHDVIRPSVIASQQDEDDQQEVEIIDEFSVSEKQEVRKQKPGYSMPFCLPPSDLFEVVDVKKSYQEKAKLLQQQAAALEEKLECFGIKGKVSAIKVGPIVTLFEYEPHIESKISKIIALEDDLALALQALSIRIIAPIPGRSVIGFEVANKQRTDVWLSQVLHSEEFKHSKARLPLMLGQDTVGDALIIDLATAPHLLVAGSTGSGKSCALNCMLMSLLFKYTPAQLKLILIDPKRLEFAVYGSVPHLLFPIVTEARKAILVLKWVVKTMEERYSMMEALSVRNIFDYQDLAKKDAQLEPLPCMVVMIDELSDLIMTAGKEIEDLIVRIAQMARAAGIHLIVATQRPSVDVVTGLIKANFPSRIAFRVTSKIDSRTILDCSGAEKLLGKGDMLYLDPGSHLRRAHGAYVTMKEIAQLVSFIAAQQEPCYVDLEQEMASVNPDIDHADEQLFKEILPFLETVDTISISSLQRRFRIGYNRSARIIEILEAQGLVMQDPSGKVRKVVRSR